MTLPAPSFPDSIDAVAALLAREGYVAARSLACVVFLALRLEKGLVFAADTRTNAGVDNVSQFRKLHFWRKPGDRVIAAKYAGTEVKVDGEECQIVRQSDILATVE